MVHCYTLVCLVRYIAMVHFPIAMVLLLYVASCIGVHFRCVGVPFRLRQRPGVLLYRFGALLLCCIDILWHVSMYLNCYSQCTCQSTHLFQEIQVVADSLKAGATVLEHYMTTTTTRRLSTTGNATAALLIVHRQ